MTTLPAPVHVLTPHPASPWPSLLRVEVLLSVAGSIEGPGLLVEYLVGGPVDELADLAIPPAQASGPADGLWQATCFELFVGRPDDPGYREFNFSPSGQWACYGFERERQRTPAPYPVHSPPLLDRRPDASPGLMAWVPATLLPDRPWLMGLSAVLAHRDGQLAFLALHHPKSRPDFHDRAGWTLIPELPTFPPSP